MKPGVPAFHDEFQMLFQPYREAVLRFCQLITGNPWDAEDVFQETLLRTYRASLQNPSMTVNKSFLFRIATNVWIDWCRKNKLSPNPLAEDEIEYRDEAFDLHEAMECLLTALEPRQAAILLLIDVFGFASGEAAQMFESTEGAVKATLHRARSALKKQAETNRIERLVERQPMLIGRFLDAFRNDDPLAIREIYMELRRTGLEIETFPQGQRLCFRFKDPEGNVIVVCSPHLR
ncbi:RNA polymerase sigma factor [Paenibacillus hemerocallicola]|uniref:RNA polymerase sigma factor n=1 Tax=Paenibacillus hemerocallicola TaxID=1172614 RepID=A0A5C4SZ72_9BACL|nr:RNA polymerase sigma factor [Paenibacillus hemerocallicola]TNJ62128.1 RNA polymerase sigma factor [Paenibacillus hemerocallicola]